MNAWEILLIAVYAVTFSILWEWAKAGTRQLLLIVRRYAGTACLILALSMS